MRRSMARQVAGGAVVSVAIAAASMATVAVGTAKADTGTTAAAACSSAIPTNCVGTGAAGRALLVGTGVNFPTLSTPSTLSTLSTLPTLQPLFGPGGLLIGNGLDALAINPGCTSDCVGGNGGLLFGNGGAGAFGGAGGNAG